MKKPTPKKVMQLDFSSCMDYLEEKYKFDHRDFAGKFTAKGMTDQPYLDFWLDFWHYICDTQGPGNGGYIYFDKDSAEDAAKIRTHDKGRDCTRRKTIVEYILKEFGEGKNQEVTFHVEW